MEKRCINLESLPLTKTFERERDLQKEGLVSRKAAASLMASFSILDNRFFLKKNHAIMTESLVIVLSDLRLAV